MDATGRIRKYIAAHSARPAHHAAPLLPAYRLRCPTPSEVAASGTAAFGVTLAAPVVAPAVLATTVMPAATRPEPVLATVAVMTAAPVEPVAMSAATASVAMSAATASVVTPTVAVAAARTTVRANRVGFDDRWGGASTRRQGGEQAADGRTGDQAEMATRQPKGAAPRCQPQGETWRRGGEQRRNGHGDRVGAGRDQRHPGGAECHREGRGGPSGESARMRRGRDVRFHRGAQLLQEGLVDLVQRPKNCRSAPGWAAWGRTVESAPPPRAAPSPRAVHSSQRPSRGDQEMHRGPFGAARASRGTAFTGVPAAMSYAVRSRGVRNGRIRSGAYRTRRGTGCARDHRHAGGHRT